MADSIVQIGLLLPEVLGTYGDTGNAQVLGKRLQWRGLDAEVVPVGLGDPVPSTLDLYLLGGGEDGAQALAAAHLRRYPGLRRAVAAGAVVFGVCAGLQVLGTRFRGLDGVDHDGLGLLDLTTEPGEQRAVAELVATPSRLLDGAALTGFENHLGVSKLGADSEPLGRVVRGTGNGDGTEGAVTDRVVGTYLHGPALARNPALADLLLAWTVGHPLGPLELTEVERLRAERLAVPRRRRGA
ncbi:glutamine amidotransferase [Amycolatopsis sp. Hca4]|uniref:type 1 glutamine amidotransferase n=1 Tax=unclassified Amycolatopsis TaxID=2618356 RepID=UPI00159245CC|nr:glutamine amidotransferase [Amycolatopsis sp. Hca4]QKV77741.1 glutamine amidotransferase [Amycolatopsis sp. Hca4]